MASTRLSTFGFRDSDASVSVSVFGREGAFHDSNAKGMKNFQFDDKEFICKFNLPTAASIVLISVFNRFIIDVTILMRSLSFGV